jgi:hypothetical protein
MREMAQLFDHAETFIFCCGFCICQWLRELGKGKKEIDRGERANLSNVDL